ncbi:hypothetical protein KAU33_07910, partial [Candidatus Dependentiae bacterium]|nr:hypothetical protein [Candidatus Dependentiae bacterium]
TVITHNDEYQYHVLKEESIPIIEDTYNKIFISTGEKVYYFDEEFKRLDVPDNGKVTDIKYVSGDFKRVLGKEMNEFKGDEKKYLVISTEKKGITIYDLITDEQLILPIFATKLAIEKNEERKNWERRPFISSKSHPKSLMIIPDKPLFKIIAAEEFANEIRVWKIGIY